MRPHLHWRRLHTSNEIGCCGEACGEGPTTRGSRGRGKRKVILLTTSRRPTSRIRTFCRDLARSIPSVVRVNRGKLNLDGIAEKALELDADRVMIVDQWKGELGKIGLFQVGPEGLTPVPPLIYVASVKLQRDFGEKVKPVRSLVIATTPEESHDVLKIADSLSSFLGVPRSSMDEAVSKYQVSMHVSSSALHCTQVTFMLLPEMIEVGPRITVSNVVWET